MPHVANCALPKKPSARCASVPDTTSNSNNGEDQRHKRVNLATLNPTEDDQQELLCRLQITNVQIAREIEEIREL
jgi:hypothetical protein